MDNNEVLALERSGWQALTGESGADFYREHLAADAVMVLPMGVLDRQAAIDAIADAPPWADFHLEQERVVEAGPDALLVIYLATAHRSGQPEYRAWMTTLYMRAGDRWQIALHQQSPEMSGG